jgi:hypothetical protein
MESLSKDQTLGWFSLIPFLFLSSPTTVEVWIFGPTLLKIRQLIIKKILLIQLNGSPSNFYYKKKKIVF